MNPNIANGLMLARIAEMHRQARRIDTGRTAHPSLMRIRWCVIGLMATAMAFLVGVPAAQAINVPPPGENSGAAPSVIIHPAAVGGMAGWQIVLIAVGSALLACALTLLAVRARRAAPAQPSTPDTGETDGYLHGRATRQPGPGPGGRAVRHQAGDSAQKRISVYRTCRESTDVSYPQLGRRHSGR